MDRDILHQYKMPVSDFNILISFSTVTLLRDHMYIYVFFLLYCSMCICSLGNNHYNNLCLNTRVYGKCMNTSLAIPHNELMILNSGNNLFFMSVDKSNAIYYCNLCKCHIDPLAWNEYYSSCISCSVNILPFNHLDEPNFQSILNGMQQNGASQDRLEDLHVDGFAIGETLFGNEDLDPDANCFQNCSNLQSKYYDIDEFVSKFKDVNDSEAPFSSIHFKFKECS